MCLRENVLYLWFLFSFSSVELSVASNPHLADPWVAGPGCLAVAAASPGAVSSNPAVWGHVAALGAVLSVAQAQLVRGLGVREVVGLHHQNQPGSSCSL